MSLPVFASDSLLRWLTLLLPKACDSILNHFLSYAWHSKGVKVTRLSDDLKTWDPKNLL